MISAYSAINRSTLEVVRSLSLVSEPVMKERDEDFPRRLEEREFVLTDKMRRVTKSVVTAHDLSQYRTQFSSIKLEENVTSWLLYLLEADKEVENVT